MSKNNFSQIPANQPATSKQFFAVTNHLAKIHADDASKTFALTKVMRAIVNNIYDYNGKPTTIERTGTVLTHGKVQELFKASEVPAEIVEKITLDFSAKKPTVSKAKSKAKPKAKAKTKSVKSKPEPTVEPTNKLPSKMNVQEFKDIFGKISARCFHLELRADETEEKVKEVDDVVWQLDEKIDLMEAKLDILMANLETNPDA